VRLALEVFAERGINPSNELVGLMAKVSETTVRKYRPDSALRGVTTPRTGLDGRIITMPKPSSEPGPLAHPDLVGTTGPLLLGL